MNLQNLTDITNNFSDTEPMPALFVGHGSPMNAIENNIFSQGWEQLGKKIPRPNIILSISAHWYTRGTFVHMSKTPQTIHDFYGFPPELYDITYDCPGSPEMADTTKSMLSSYNVLEDYDWGIDHGTWVVLRRMYPDHSIPVFQLSLDLTKPPQWHYELAQMLQPLREKGVLLMGSGNIVHNLSQVDFDPNPPAYDWALEFDEIAKNLILSGDHNSLIQYTNLGRSAQLSIPTPDHYLPLLYTLGVQRAHEKIQFPIEGIVHGSISMRTLTVG